MTSGMVVVKMIGHHVIWTDNDTEMMMYHPVIRIDLGTRMMTEGGEVRRKHYQYIGI